MADGRIADGHDRMSRPTAYEAACERPSADRTAAVEDGELLVKSSLVRGAALHGRGSR